MAFPSTARLTKMSDEDLLEQLCNLGVELQALNARQRVLWAQRLELYQAARSRTPAITHRRLGAAAGVSEVAIITKLKQLAERGNGTA